MPYNPARVAAVKELRRRRFGYIQIGRALGITAQAAHYLDKRWEGWRPGHGMA